VFARLAARQREQPAARQNRPAAGSWQRAARLVLLVLVLLPVAAAVPIVLRPVRAAGPAPMAAQAGQPAERAVAAGRPPVATPAEAFRRADVRPGAPERALRLAEQLVVQPVADAALVAEPRPVGPAAPADARPEQRAEAAGSRPAAGAAAAEQRQEAAEVVAQPPAAG
jgi:hypothetical protein